MTMPTPAEIISLAIKAGFNPGVVTEVRLMRFARLVLERQQELLANNTKDHADDLIARLRGSAPVKWEEVDSVMLEAADEIERLINWAV